MSQNEAVYVDMSNVSPSELIKYDSRVSDWMCRMPLLPTTEMRDLGHVQLLSLDNMYLSQGTRWCACGSRALFLGEVDFVLSGRQTRFECSACARLYLPKHLQTVAKYDLPRDQAIVITLLRLGGHVVSI